MIRLASGGGELPGPANTIDISDPVIGPGETIFSIVPDFRETNLPLAAARSINTVVKCFNLFIRSSHIVAIV